MGVQTGIRRWYKPGPWYICLVQGSGANPREMNIGARAPYDGRQAGESPLLSSRGARAALLPPQTASAQRVTAVLSPALQPTRIFGEWDTGDLAIGGCRILWRAPGPLQPPKAMTGQAARLQRRARGENKARP
jgi:hypothetical protein